MSLGKKILVFFLALIVLLASLAFGIRYRMNYASQLTELQLRRHKSYMLAEELRRSSDDLSRMARTYAVTGDVRYKQYFETITAIRDGLEPRPRDYDQIFWDFVTANHNYQPSVGTRISIIDMMKKLKFSPEEFEELAAAKAESDKLTDMEKEAFNAMIGLIKNGDGTYRDTGKPDQVRAQKILFGNEYHQQKAKIMGHINAFFRLLEKRTAREIAEKEAQQQEIAMLLIILSLMLIFLSIIGYYAFQFAIVVPINRIVGWTHGVEQGTYEFHNDIKKKDEIGVLASAFIKMAKTVSDNLSQCELFSRTDQLTKINNRIALDEALQNARYAIERYNEVYSLILVDIDHFKQVNDQYGHIVGDKVLIEIAGLLEDNIRQSDIVGRWGGEEFLILCPHTNIDQCRVVAESLREKIAAFPFSTVGHKTASFGISLFDKRLSIEAIIDQADQALYRAKEGGRNRVC